jgi:hypothetical protein
MRGGGGMADDLGRTAARRTIAPARYATLVAEDSHLAFECAQLSAVGDSIHALEVVSHAADDILGHCAEMPVITPTGSDSSLLQSLRNVERVAKRSDQSGDDVQASWCILLYQELVGLGCGDRVPAREPECRRGPSARARERTGSLAGID